MQYLQQAGENDIQRSAHREAVDLLTKGLELLKTLPVTSERARKECSLYIALGTALIATKGFAASEVGLAYSRARELCQQTGTTPETSRVLWGLWVFHLTRAELQTVLELGEQLLRLAQRE